MKTKLNKYFMSKNYFLIKHLSLMFFLCLFCSSSFANEDDRKKIAGITPLMQAVLNDDISGVAFFIKTNEDEINKQNIGGATALHIASRIGNYEIANILIKKGADLDIQDNEGWTPIMRASSSAYHDLVKLLIDSGSKTDIINDNKDSAITISAKARCNECVVLIADNIISKGNKDKAEKLKNQLTEGFVIAKAQGNDELQEIFDKKLDKINNLEIKENDETQIANSDDGSKKVFTSDKIAKKVKTENNIITDHNQSEKNLASNQNSIAESNNIKGIIDDNDDVIIGDIDQKKPKENTENKASGKKWFSFLGIFGAEKSTNEAILADNNKVNDDIAAAKTNEKEIVAKNSGENIKDKNLNQDKIDSKIDKQQSTKEAESSEINQLAEDIKSDNGNSEKTGFFDFFAFLKDKEDSVASTESTIKEDATKSELANSNNKIKSDVKNYGQKNSLDPNKNPANMATNTKNEPKNILKSSNNEDPKKDVNNKTIQEDQKENNKINEANENQGIIRLIIDYFKNKKKENKEEGTNNSDQKNDRDLVKSNNEKVENKAKVKKKYNLFNFKKNSSGSKDNKKSSKNNIVKEPDNNKKFIFKSFKKKENSVNNKTINDDFSNDPEFQKWKNAPKPEVREIKRKFIFGN